MRLRALTIALAGIVLAACLPGTAGSSPTASARPPSQPSSGPELAGSVSVQGDYELSASFTTRVAEHAEGVPTPPAMPASCAEYAMGFQATSQDDNARAFLPPVVQTTGKPAVFIRSMISSGYGGPGTYNSNATPGLSGGATVQGDAFTVYHSTTGSTTTLTVQPDGSGTLSFSRWRSTEVRGGIIAGYLSGTVTWSCH